MSTAPWSLGVFGKLPIYKDFLRFRCSSGPARIYQDWLYKGQSRAAYVSKDLSFQLGRTWRLLHVFDRGREAVSALVRDSADEGNHRRFPFSPFLTTARCNLGETFREGFRCGAGSWSFLADCDRHLSAAANVAEFQGRAKELLAAVPPVEACALEPAAVAILGLAEALFPKSEDPAKGFAKLMWKLCRAAMTIRSGIIPETRLPVLGIPLAPGFDPLIQAAAWIGFLEASGLGLGPGAKGYPPSVAVPETADDGAQVWIVYRCPEPAEYLALPETAVDCLFPALAGKVGEIKDLPDQDAYVRAASGWLERGRTLADLAGYRHG